MTVAVIGDKSMFGKSIECQDERKTKPTYTQRQHTTQPVNTLLAREPFRPIERTLIVLCRSSGKKHPTARLHLIVGCSLELDCKICQL